MSAGWTPICHLTAKMVRTTDPPNDVPHVIGYEQGTGPVYHDADRPAPSLAALGHKPSQDVLWRPRWLAVFKRDKDHLVAAARLAVPGAVLADESPVPVPRREKVTGVECEAERGRVVAERVVRGNR